MGLRRAVELAEQLAAEHRRSCSCSRALLVVDFNYVRKHATEDDVVWLATGIFVSIVNIFLSLLNLLGRR